MTKRIVLALIFCFITLPSFAAPLPANEAFQLVSTPFDPNTVLIEWTIKPGYFLYKKSLQVTKNDADDLTIGQIQYPAPEIKINRQGQQFLIYRDSLSLHIPVLSDNAGETLIEAHFQGCSDEGFCYPPEFKKIKLTFDSQHKLWQTVIDEQDAPQPSRVHPGPGQPTDFPKYLAPKIKRLTKAAPSESDFHLLFTSKSAFFVILSFFGFGLLLAFTPCVLPMVPVLSGIIVGHGHQLSTRKAFFLSLCYVLSMSLTYGLIGAVIAVLGSNLQIVMQSPWVIGLFSFVFVLLALSMLGVYELRLPLSLQNTLAKVTRSQAGGHYLSAALMGCMSTLVLSPCVTAPLIGALSYIAQTGDMTLGLISLFFLGFGMGTPLLLIGTSAGKLLPKAGKWMNTVKAFFGILLLGIAIYLLSRIVPPFITMGLWASLCIFTGVALKPFNSSETKKWNQGLGIILICYGIFILYGASSGHTNPLKPLELTQIHSEIPSIVVKNVKDAEKMLVKAKNKNTPVMLDFYADWCASCKVIARTTLQDRAILSQLQRIQMITIDLSNNNQDSRELLKYFNIVAPPTFLFYDAQGNPRHQLHLIGDVSTEALLDRLKQL